MEGKGKRIFEEGESSTRPYKRTARISRRPYMTEWLQRLDEPESVGLPSSDERRAPTAQIDPTSGQSPIEAEHETTDPLKSEPVEDDLQLLSFDQLQQEMDWMENFNKNTLESQKAPPQPERSEDSDPLQYLQEPAEEENQMKDLEEDPEKRPPNINLEGEVNRENQAESGGEPAGAEAEAAEEDEGENENEEENEDGEENADEEDEDAEGNDEVDNDENDNEEEDEDENTDDEEDDDGNEDDNEDDDEDEDEEASDEDVGTVSPTSTITTV